MNSIKSQCVNFIIRNNHLFRGKWRKEVFDGNTSIARFREQCEKGAARYGRIPRDIIIRKDRLNGINMEYHTPTGAPEDKIILYLHGGGYVSGSCNDHRGFVAKFANYTGFTCLLFEYRLAPEHPFPAALEDSLKVYQHLLSSGYAPEKIVLAGESAGGGLTLALLLAIKSQELPLPKAAVAISPWTDLTCSSGSYTSKNKVSAAPLNSWTVFSNYYVGGDSASNPFISPLFGELAGLPPILVNSGVDDELFEDGEKFYHKAKAAGVDVRFRAGKGMLHCYPLLAPMFPEATEAMNEIVDFIKTNLK
ncbi:MAG: alpha/beta hydrolase [Bacteroidota bacterium]